MNAVIYARYSSDNQREESIEGQIRENTAYAEKHGINLANTIGIIDGDYYMNEDNEGHILLALHNSSDEPQVISIGDRVAQGIILECHTAYGAQSGAEERRGGFGSTGI